MCPCTFWHRTRAFCLLVCLSELSKQESVLRVHSLPCQVYHTTHHPHLEISRSGTTVMLHGCTVCMCACRRTMPIRWDFSVRSCPRTLPSRAHPFTSFPSHFALRHNGCYVYPALLPVPLSEASSDHPVSGTFCARLERCCMRPPPSCSTLSAWRTWAKRWPTP